MTGRRPSPNGAVSQAGAAPRPALHHTVPSGGSSLHQHQHHATNQTHITTSSRSAAAGALSSAQSTPSLPNAPLHPISVHNVTASGLASAHLTSHPLPALTATAAPTTNPPLQQGGTATLNTELRAQARREREATREKSREKLVQQQHQSGNHACPSAARERSCSIASGNVERKISPKLGTKPASNVAAPVTSSSSLTSQRHSMQRANMAQRNGPASDTTLMSQHDSVLATTSATLDSYLPEGLPSLHGIEGLVARIPSPPKLGDDQSDERLSQSTQFVKQYYALLEKCQSWQRYATNIKARVDHLEIENRYLRETNRKHEEDVHSLEQQMKGLKETAMMLEEERRRSESRRELYPPGPQDERPVLRHPASQPIRRPSELGGFTSHVPSPPSVAPIIHNLNDATISGSSANEQLAGQALYAANLLDEGTVAVDLRPATSSSMLSLPGSLHSAATYDNSKDDGHSLCPTTNELYDTHDRYAHITQSQTQILAHAHSRVHGQSHGRHDSHIADILAQDAANREAAACHEQRPTRRQGTLGIAESHSFPPSDTSRSATLATQTLAAAGRERPAAMAMKRLPSSSSAPMLRPSGVQPSPAEHTLRHQASDGNGTMTGTKRQELHQSDDVQSHAPTTGLSVRGAHTATLDGRLSTVPGSRSGSVQSDALTVTEDYLQGIVEHKRQLRKISLSQQQQLHYLQARVHMNGGNRPSSSLSNNENAPSNGLMSAPLPGDGTVNSRPSSRLSSHRVGGKMRSRAGSYSLHDAIPVDKDDVFSSQSEQRQRAIRRSGSAPLGQVNLNGRSGAMSALELRHYPNPSDSDASFELDEDANKLGDPSDFNAISRESSREDLGADPLSDNDPKGAHRRLYIRLRDELSTPELVRFERYVHKYDALQIEMEGPKGIINRVRRLLLPEEIVRSKTTNREKYQFRKELAREFERIVREDAVPSEVNTQVVQQPHEEVQAAEAAQAQ